MNCLIIRFIFIDLGVGFDNKDYDNVWLDHQDSFDLLLSNLKSTNNDEEVTNVENNDNQIIAKVDSVDETQLKSLEEKSKTSRARVHYRKFTKSKDLTNATKHDLDCILGRHKRVNKLKCEINEQNSATNSGNNSNNEDENSNSGGSNNNSSKEEVKSSFLTITNTQSINDYFAQKMAEIHKRRLNGTHKIEQDSVEVSQNYENSEVNNDEKKLKHNHEHESVEVLNGFEQNEDCEEKKHKKNKKKKKKEVEIEEEIIGNKDNEVIVENGEKKKKNKKKKEHFEEEVSNENGVEKEEEAKNYEIEGVNEEINNFEKKKKNKKKQDEIGEDIIENNDNQVIFENGENNVEKKKNKKKKKEHVEEVNNENGVGKEAKNDEIEGFDQALNEEINNCEKMKHKKKKSKKELTIHDVNIDLGEQAVVDENVDDLSEKKIKNKKNSKKEATLVAENNTVVEYDDDDVAIKKSKKKKKKKKKAENDDVDNENQVKDDLNEVEKILENNNENENLEFSNIRENYYKMKEPFQGSNFFELNGYGPFKIYESVEQILKKREERDKKKKKQMMKRLAADPDAYKFKKKPKFALYGTCNEIETKNK